MEKTRYKITLNWQGEIHEFYKHANSPSQALRFSIRELARETGYAARFVRNYVMDTSQRRWEVSR